jgi:hypothetical protein
VAADARAIRASFEPAHAFILSDQRVARIARGPHLRERRANTRSSERPRSDREARVIFTQASLAVSRTVADGQSVAFRLSE